MRLLLSVLIRVKAAAWRFNQLDNWVLPRKALYWCYLVSRETLQAYYAPLQKLKIKQKSKLMPRSEINFVVRARGAVFEVRGPVTTSFGLGHGVEWKGGGGANFAVLSLCLFRTVRLLNLSSVIVERSHVYKFQAAENSSNSRI